LLLINSYHYPITKIGIAKPSYKTMLGLKSISESLGFNTSFAFHHFNSPTFNMNCFIVLGSIRTWHDCSGFKIEVLRYLFDCALHKYLPRYCNKQEETFKYIDIVIHKLLHGARDAFDFVLFLPTHIQGPSLLGSFQIGSFSRRINMYN
jgi:hypothetical protein